MSIFERMRKSRHEQLVFCFNRPTGLRAIISIHDTTLGTSVGGTKLMAYASEDEAIVDALRLSEIMTLESASLESDMGGGAAVLMAADDTDLDEAYFRGFGRFVEGLKGLFLTYPGFGTTDRQFTYVRRETESVIPREGNREITAFGVVSGMKACVREVTGHSTLGGIRVAVQGVGKVGQFLVDELVAEGADVTVTDIRYDQIKAVQDRHAGARVVRPDEILSIECDVLSPCAVGRVLNDETIPKLRCRIVAGAASDILEEPRHAEALRARGILYAPDFVIGGTELLQTEPELRNASRERLREEARHIHDVMASLITQAKKEGTTPYRVAVERAARRVARIGTVRHIMC